MTTNEFLPAGWDETVWRLAAGIEPVSALGGAGPLPGVRLALERVPKPWPVPAGAGTIGDYDVGIGLPTVARNPSGRFAVTYLVPGLVSPFSVRMYDVHRRYVPRRFAVPFPAPAAVVAEEHAAEAPPWPPIPSRSFRPALFPGAAYGTQAGATVVRGRVLRSDLTVARWTRVSAVDADYGYPLGWAHGDDRGEFLLVITSSSAELHLPGSALSAVTVTVAARPLPSTIDSPAQSTADPLWDLEVETLPSPGSADAVSDGRAAPADYSQTQTATYSLVKGVVSRLAEPIVLP